MSLMMQAARRAGSSLVRSAAAGRRSLSENSRLRVKTFNKISPVGLGKFDEDKYDVSPDHTTDSQAIILRSHKLSPEDVPAPVRCIARCGAGTNNCQTELMTELGVPVFNTPGSNANAVKELVLCSLLLASRGIIDGSLHMKQLHAEGVAAERIEKDKALFGGQEIKGKTLGVIGLGHIGAAVAEAASQLGMNVVAYDPMVSVEMAWKIDGRNVKRVDNIRGIAAVADYVSVHVPFIPGATENLLGDDFFLHMKPTAHILNFARGGIVDSLAYRRLLDAGAPSRYICDFAEDDLWDHPNVTIIPHLGASTEEAEVTSSIMAANTMMKFLETGAVENSVNFPAAQLEQRSPSHTRMCVTNVNTPGVLSAVFGVLSDAGLNVEQQYSTSNDNLGYHMIDFQKTSAGDAKTRDALQEAITMLPNVLSTRFIMDSMGQHYAVQREGKYIK